MSDPDAPPSKEELAAADRLRRALEPGSREPAGDPEWELVQAIRAATDPAPISDERQRQILSESLSRRPKGKVVYLAFGGVGSLVAMAAAFALVIRSQSPEVPVASGLQASRAVSRSTSELFPDGIPARGGTSERVDRIAYARARDLRENRFARWGVR